MAQQINTLTDLMLTLALMESDDIALTINALDAVVCGIEHINRVWYSTYTINSLHYHRSTGLCTTSFDGKTYSL